MPRRSVVVELLPFFFSSTLFRKLALRSGVRHLAWHNTHVEAAAFRGNCWHKGGFQEMGEEACMHVHECVTCVRDRSITKVNSRELLEVMRNARLLVRQFLPRNKEWL